MQLIVFISKNSTPVIYRQKFLTFALLLCFGVLTGNDEGQDVITLAPGLQIWHPESN
jgi:hypothetical protein